MDWSEGDLVWFDPSIGHPLPGEIQEVHRAAQVTIVQAMINGKVSRNSASANRQMSASGNARRQSRLRLRVREWMRKSVKLVCLE